MNERIRELAEQASNKTSREMVRLHDIRSWQISFEETFAQLIIKECMTICEDVIELNQPAIACYYEIKKRLYNL